MLMFAQQNEDNSIEIERLCAKP